MAEIDVGDSNESPEDGKVSEATLRAESDAADAKMLAELRGETPPAEKPAKRQAQSSVAVEDEPAAQTSETEDATGDEAAASEDTSDDEQYFDLGGDLSNVSMTEIREALEARADLDGGNQAIAEKQARFERAIADVRAEREGLARDREQLNRDIRPIQNDAAAYRRLLPFLEQEDWNGLASFVQGVKQQIGAPQRGAGAGGLTPAQVEQIIDSRLDQDRKGSTLSSIDAMAGSIIDRNPEFRTVFGDIREDTIDRLKKRLIPEAKAGNFTSRSPAEEIRPIILKHLKAMRLAEVARAQRIAGGGAKNQVRVTGKLPPISKTAGVRAPTKPKSMQVDYGATGAAADKDFDSHIKRMLLEHDEATR